MSSAASSAVSLPHSPPEGGYPSLFLLGPDLRDKPKRGQRPICRFLEEPADHYTRRKHHQGPKDWTQTSHPTRRCPDQKVWVWVPFSSLNYINNSLRIILCNGRDLITYPVLPFLDFSVLPRKTLKLTKDFCPLSNPLKTLEKNK